MQRTDRHPRHDKLLLFKTPNGKSQNWYCGFHHRGSFIRVSTRSACRSTALQFAEQWYLDRLYEIRHGAIVMPGKRFGAVAQNLIKRLAAERGSDAYCRVLRNYLRQGGYLHRYFGQTNVAAINTRSWDDFRVWLGEARRLEDKSSLAERTVHQLKNAVRLVLRQAYIERLIDDIPRFHDLLRARKTDSRPRVYFNEEEYRSLLGALSSNVERHQLERTRWRESSKDLRDYVVFLANTGLRVSEGKALRVRDVRLLPPRPWPGLQGLHEVCEITIIGGKRGAHPPSQSAPGAATAFHRIIERRRISDPMSCDDPLFPRHHHEAFKRILRDHELYTDRYGRKRDFVSLRHTFICFCILSGISVFDVARRSRTSVTMIEQHYARALSMTHIFEPQVWLVV